MYFTIISDCQALIFLYYKRTLQPKIARWYTTVYEYDFEIKHKGRAKMTHVDSLGRAAVGDANPRRIIEVNDNLQNVFTSQQRKKE